MESAFRRLGVRKKSVHNLINSDRQGALRVIKGMEQLLLFLLRSEVKAVGKGRSMLK